MFLNFLKFITAQACSVIICSLGQKLCSLPLCSHPFLAHQKFVSSAKAEYKTGIETNLCSLMDPTDTAALNMHCLGPTFPSLRSQWSMELDRELSLHGNQGPIRSGSSREQLLTQSSFCLPGQHTMVRFRRKGPSWTENALSPQGLGSFQQHSVTSLS